MLTGFCYLQYGSFPQVTQPEKNKHKLSLGKARYTGAGGMKKAMVSCPLMLSFCQSQIQLTLIRADTVFKTPARTDYKDRQSVCIQQHCCYHGANTAHAQQMPFIWHSFIQPASTQPIRKSFHGLHRYRYIEVQKVIKR